MPPHPNPVTPAPPKNLATLVIVTTLAEAVMCLTMTAPPPPPPPAPGWYPDPSGGPGQRYWDGSKWTDVNVPSTPPPIGPPIARRSTSPLKVLLTIGAVMFALVGGCAACVAVIGGHNSSPTSSPSSAARDTPRTTSAAPPPGIGQEARDGKFAFTVTGVETLKTMSDEFETKTAQGVYAVVSMTVRNTGNQPQSFFGIDQKLKDAAGREFAASFGVYSGGTFHDGDDINEHVPSRVDFWWRSMVNSMRRYRRCRGWRVGAGRRRAGASACSP